MSRSAVLPWILLAIWSAWIGALQGWLGSRAALAPWVPDAVLVLLLSLCARLDRKDLPKAALVVGLARSAVSIEPAASLLAGVLGVVLVVRVLSSVLEIGDPPARTVLAFLGALLLARWQALVLERDVLAAAGLAAPSLAETWRDAVGALGPRAWSRAAATALCALMLGPALAHLPGLTPLRRRRTWHAAASARSW